MISIDDYNLDNFKIAKLLLKYDLEEETIFFIDFRLDAELQIKWLSDLGFEIGSHTINHSFLNEISKGQAKFEIMSSKDKIEEITGKECKWFCYPRGRYSKEILKLVKEAGYKFARTTKLTDGKTNFEKAGNHLSFERKEYGGIDPFEWAYKSKLNHYWLHAKELLERGWLGRFEQFLKWYSGIRIINEKK